MRTATFFVRRNAMMDTNDIFQIIAEKMRFVETLSYAPALQLSAGL
jgi:hypothetical protein